MSREKGLINKVGTNLSIDKKNTKPVSEILNFI